MPVINVTALPDSPADLTAIIEAATDKLAATTWSSLGEHELLAMACTIERTSNKRVGVTAAVTAEIATRNAYQVGGYQRMRQFLTDALHLSAADARRRVEHATHLTRRTTHSGHRLEPLHPATAAAVSDGSVNPAHVDIIARTLTKIPASIGADIVARAETQLADAARTLTPEDLAKASHRLLGYLDPDGAITADRDRRRQRRLTLMPQDQQLMSKICAQLTPAVRAKFEAILAVWAAPGMNNPDDPNSPHGASDTPALDQDALAAARERDSRTTGERNHDALEALCDYVLGHGALGRPDRLPAELVITTTLSDLHARTGYPHTATGTTLTWEDLIRAAADADPHLEIFANGTGEVLHLHRGTRIATKAQRLALFGRDRGCTAPGCDMPFSHTEAHHLTEWQYGGPTDIDNLGAACGRHNRAVGSQPGRWETKLIETGTDAGRVGWRHTGSREPWRTNPLHHLMHPATNSPPDAADAYSDVESRLTQLISELPATG